MPKAKVPRPRTARAAPAKPVRRADEAQALSGTNAERAGDHNQRVTLQVIRVAGSATRAEITARTGLTAATVANITGRLIEEGLIRETGRIRGSRGQPAIKLGIDADARFSLGINVDRDHITVVLLDFLGTVRARKSVEVAFAGPQTVQTFLSEAIGALVKEAGIVRARVIGCGVAFPDDLTRTRLPEQPEAYSEWAGTDITQLVAKIVRVPVQVENDAAAAAIGEMHFGAGQRYRSFFYLLVTAALGGGVVIDGSYFRGAGGRSGEIGWLQAPLKGGKSAQLQRIVSLSGLYERLAHANIRVHAPGDITSLPPKGVTVVRRWIGESTDALVPSLLAINCLINPDAILIGGRLPASVVDQLAQSINERLAVIGVDFPAVAPVARATLADDAPAVGAAILAFSDNYLPARHALLKPGLDPSAGVTP